MSANWVELFRLGWVGSSTYMGRISVLKDADRGNRLYPIQRQDLSWGGSAVWFWSIFFAYEPFSFMFQSISIHQNQPASISINQHYSESTSINHQWESMRINRYQSASISVNQHQLAISINQHHPASISINQHQWESTIINQYQTASISINQHQ